MTIKIHHKDMYLAYSSDYALEEAGWGKNKGEGKEGLADRREEGDRRGEERKGEEGSRGEGKRWERKRGGEGGGEEQFRG